MDHDITFENLMGISIIGSISFILLHIFKILNKLDNLLFLYIIHDEDNRRR
jgi:hypothetical protein